jgi:spermidine dehydrogenase
LLTTTFATFEHNIRDQLGRALGGGGFDPARDIEAITVNQWPHGYAAGSNSLYDPEWSDEEVPWIVGRKRYGAAPLRWSWPTPVSFTDSLKSRSARVRSTSVCAQRSEISRPSRSRIA